MTHKCVQLTEESCQLRNYGSCTCQAYTLGSKAFCPMSDCEYRHSGRGTGKKATVCASAGTRHCTSIVGILSFLEFCIGSIQSGVLTVLQHPGTCGYIFSLKAMEIRTQTSVREVLNQGKGARC